MIKTYPPTQWQGNHPLCAECGAVAVLGLMYKHQVYCGPCKNKVKKENQDHVGNTKRHRPSS